MVKSLFRVLSRFPTCWGQVADKSQTSRKEVSNKSEPPSSWKPAQNRFSDRKSSSQFLDVRKLVAGKCLLMAEFQLPYILAYKSLPRISRHPKKRVPVWSKIVDPRISRRWTLRTCTGCKLL